MNEQRRRVLENKYVLVDYRTLCSDVHTRHCAMNKEDGKGLGERFLDKGMSHSTLSNIRHNYKKNVDALEWSDEFEYCEETGICNKLWYRPLCELFSLNEEDYILKKKPKEVKEEMTQTDVYGELILAQLTELTKAINNLGSIELQNMEYLKELKECWKGDK